MGDGDRPAARAYARAIERAWSELRECPVVFSPRDWTLVADWFARGIPLELVREALEAAGERRRRRTTAPARTLSYIAPAVEEAWAVILDGRRSPPVERARRDPRESAVSCWNGRLEREPQGSPLRALLSALLSALDHGESPVTVDRRLDAELEALVSRERVAAAEREVSRQLAAFRDRMTREVLEETRRRAIVDRLRAEMGLPRLARIAPEDPPEPPA